MKLAALIVLCGLALVLLGLGFWLYTPDLPRETIESRYHVSPGDYREIAGLRLHLREAGTPDHPAIIFLHGFGSSLETWDPWFAALSASHRVVAFDWPGFGLTGPDPTGDYTDARSLIVLAAVMDAIGLARASLVGNSMGGKLAWMFAAQRPDRVEKLVLISPDGFATPGFEYGRQPVVPFAVRLLPYVLPTMLLRMSLSPAFGDPKALTPALTARYQDFMRAPGVRNAMLARLEQVVLAPPEPLLRAIKAPTLLLWGEKDGFIPFSNAADYGRLIPHVTLVALPALGHVPQEEAPSQSLEPVRRFLAARPD